MAEGKKRKIRLDIVLGAVVLFLLLSISIPLVVSHIGSTSTPSSLSPIRTGIDVPIESDDYTIGDEDAPVTIVAFVDYQCSSCKIVADITLTELKQTFIAEGVVKFVIKDFPLNEHANAFLAAVAARAAGEQGKYWEMHDHLFQNQKKWSDVPHEELHGLFARYAAEFGLNLEQFKRDLHSDKLENRVTVDRELGEQLGVRFTPTIIVNGSLYENAITPDDWSFIIQESTK